MFLEERGRVGDGACQREGLSKEVAVEEKEEERDGEVMAKDSRLR